MIDFTVSLENENILLRPMLPGDLEDYYKVTTEHNMWTYFSSDLSNKQELTAWISVALKQRKKKERLPFSVVVKSDNQVAGSSSFGNISNHDNRLEIGWTWLAKAYHGKGINSQVKHLMLRYGFETLRMERIEFKTDILNIPARKALTKIGCVEEGVLRSHTLMTHNRRRDTIYYSILKSEWAQLKQKNKWT